MLQGIGEIEIEVFSSNYTDQLLLKFVPSSDGVDVVVDNTGIGEWKHVKAAVSAAIFDSFVVELLDLIQVADGDCGTHGFWVTRCAIKLPLAFASVDVEDRQGDKFSSEPVVQHVLAFVDQLAVSPAGYAVSRRASRRQRKLAIAAIAISALTALGLVLHALR